MENQDNILASANSLIDSVRDAIIKYNDFAKENSLETMTYNCVHEARYIVTEKLENNENNTN